MDAAATTVHPTRDRLLIYGLPGFRINMVY